MAIMNNHYKVLLYKNFKNDERYEWSCHVVRYIVIIVIIIMVATNYYVCVSI